MDADWLSCGMTGSFLMNEAVDPTPADDDEDDAEEVDDDASLRTLGENDEKLGGLALFRCG